MKNKLTISIVFLSFSIIFLPFHLASASRVTYAITLSSGTTVNLKATLPSTHLHEEITWIDVYVTLVFLPPEVQDIHNIEVEFKIGSFYESSINIEDIITVGTTKNGSGSFVYASDWGEQNLQLRFSCCENNTETRFFKHYTNWLTFFKIGTPTFFSQYKIPIFVVGIPISLALLLFFNSQRKKLKS